MASIVLLTGSPSLRQEADIDGVSEDSLSIYLGPKAGVVSWACLSPPIVAQTGGEGVASHNPLYKRDSQQSCTEQRKHPTCVTCIDACRS